MDYANYANAGYATAQRKAMHARLRHFLGCWLLTKEAAALERMAADLALSLERKRFVFTCDEGACDQERRETIK